MRGGEAVAADLVIDASGRSSRLGQWLAEAGWEAPRELVVDAKVGYATRIYRCPEDYSGPKAVLCGTRPAGTRSGLLAPIEGGRWNVRASTSVAVQHMCLHCSAALCRVCALAFR